MKQHLIGHRDLPAVLRSAHRLNTALAEERWVKVARNAYVDGTTWKALSTDDRRYLRLAALSRQTMADHMFSHTTAAWLWGFPFHTTAQGAHMLRRTNTQSRTPGLAMHHFPSRVWNPTARWGLPVSRQVESVVDACTLLPFAQGVTLADSALRHGVPQGDLRSLVHMMAGRHHVLKLRRVLDFATPLSGSVGESLARVRLLELGLPAPELQFEVRAEFGRYFLDFAYPGLKVAIEFDGKVKYSGTYGTPSDVAWKERRREQDLQAEGWLVIRLVWADLFDLAVLRRKLRPLFERLGRV